MKNFIINLNKSTSYKSDSKLRNFDFFRLANIIIITITLMFSASVKAETYVVYEGFPDNSTDNKPALDYILTKCDTLFIPSGADYYKIVGTVIIPLGKTLIFDSNAKFNVTGTLKGNQTNIIASESEIFESASNISGTWLADTIYSKWTGAKGDGITDDFLSLKLFFNLLSITENNQAVLGVNKQYYIKNQILYTVDKAINLDGRGSRIFREYADMTTGENILMLTGSISTTKIATTNLVAGQLTMEINNTEGLETQMGIELLSNELYGKEYMGGSSWHYHYKGMLSKIQSIDGNTITMVDSIPHDFLATEVSSVRFYNIYPVIIRNLNFGSENITGSNKMNQLVVRQLFDVELNNITCSPLGYSGIGTKSIYNGYFSKITCLKPGAGEDNYVFGVYGIIPDLNVNCIYDSIYTRATTHGIAFTNEPSYNVIVKNSDFKASWYGSNGVDSHASKWVKFQNCIIYGAQGNWGTFIFDNCEMHEIANGQAHIWNEREGAGRGNLEVIFKNCNFYTKANGSSSTNIFWRTPVLETSTNIYTIVNSNFYLENNISYLFNSTNFGTASNIKPIRIEGNHFYGTGTLYLPKNYGTTPSSSGGVFTFQNNVYSTIRWTSPPFDQFETINIVNNTPADDNTSDFWVEWDNRSGNVNFSENVFVGTCFWMKDCNGNITFENNEFHNYKLKSNSTYKDRNYITGNSNLTFTNNNLHNTYWTLTGNLTVSDNMYNGQLQPEDPSGNWENIYITGNSIETGITMEGISNYTIISRAKMDDITTNAVQNLVGSSVTKLYLGFNPSGTTPVTRPSIRNEDGTIVRPVLSKYYLDTLWHTYVFTMENGVLKAYMDGIAMLSYDASAVYNKMYATGTIQIGGANSNEKWNGPIKTFAIYNRVLSLAESNSFSENPGLVLEGELYRLVNLNNGINPIGHWAFDEATGSVAIDSSENNIQGMLMNGPVWAEGIRNNAIQLDGLNDRIECGTNSALDMAEDNFTISTWVKLDVSQVSYPTIVAKGGSSRKNAGYWFFLANSKLYFLMGDGVTRISANSDIVNINDNSWHHIAVTVERNGNAVFYLDGYNSGTYDVSNFFGKKVSNPTKNFTIGSLENSSTTFLKGLLDDFRIYNRALTGSEIANLAVLPQSAETLIAYWEFDENYGTIAIDSSANCFCGNLINGPEWTVGSKGHAISFDGQNDKVEFVSDPALDMGISDMSIAAWLKMGTNQLSYPTIVSKGGTSNTNAGYWFYTNGTEIKFAIGDGNERKSSSSNSINILDNDWHHVAITVDRDENAIFYLDGENVGSSDISSFKNKNISNPSKDLTVGSAASSSTTYFNGSIDGVRIFSSALDGQKIDSLANIRDCDIAVYLTFDENSGNVAFDSSENGNDGVLENGPSWETGVIGNSVQFDGRNDKINCGNAQELEMSTDDITIATWVNMPPSQASYSSIFSKGGYVNTNAGYWLYLRNGALHFSIADGTDQFLFNSDNNYITDNSWHHIAISIKRDSTLSFFIDGENAGTYDATSFQNLNITNTEESLIIGSADYRPTYFKGKIDEFRVYRRALTESEIIDLAYVPQQSMKLLDISDNYPKTENNNLNVYPNPFITSVILSFSMEEEQNIQADIYALNGNRIKTLQKGVINKGENMLTWDGTDNFGREVTKGLYVVQIISDSKVFSKTIVKMR